MDEMLDHYYLKLLPWRPNVGSRTRVLVEDNHSFVLEAPFFHEDGEEATEGDIYMVLIFDHFGNVVSFDGIHY